MLGRWNIRMQGQHEWIAFVIRITSHPQTVLSWWKTTEINTAQWFTLALFATAPTCLVPYTLTSSVAWSAREVQKTAQDVTRQAWELLIERHSTREAGVAAPRRRPIAIQYSIKSLRVITVGRHAGRPGRQAAIRAER